MRLAGFLRRDLTRNPRRTLASMVGVVVGVGLFSGVLFFVDASGASMTRRAIAPLALDLQRVLTTPPGGTLRLERMVVHTPAGADAGESTRIRLLVVNDTAAPANEVVVRDRPAPSLRYVPASTYVQGVHLPDVAGAQPTYQGSAGTGLNIGTLAPGESRRISFRVEGSPDAAAVSAAQQSATVSSREIPSPLRANARPPLGLHELAEAVGRIDGVATASPLAFVSLPGGMTAPGRQVEGPVKLFSFDAAYAANYPSIRIRSGRIEPGHVAISAEAARDLGVAEGASIAIELPGAEEPLVLPISGITDLSGARPLFESREWRRFEKFVYAPYTAVVDAEVYRTRVEPALAIAAAERNSEVASYPFSELDVRLDRTRLDADPARALAQAQAVAAAVRAVAPDQDSLIDNLGNTLAVAKGDATIAKRMFVFLGLPGAVLAAILTAYAGGLLAAAQRRETALLRVRGATAGALAYLLGLRTVVLAGLGAVAGTALGFGAVLILMGRQTVFAAADSALLQSAGVAVGGGMAVTAVALYLPGRRLARLEIAHQLGAAPRRTGAGWLRLGLEGLALLAAVTVQVLALRAGAFDGPPGSVYSGRSVSLPLHLLVAPIVGWLAGTLFVAHLLAALTAGTRTARRGRAFRSLLRGVLWRSVTRRVGALAGGVVAVALVVGLGTMLACFATAYDRAQADDARFAVGSDIRLTPNPTSGLPRPLSLAADLARPAHAGVAAVLYAPENAALSTPIADDPMTMAAVDPVSYPRVAALVDAGFVNMTARQAMAALADHPNGILLNAAVAASMQIAVGDEPRLLLARDSDQQIERPVRVLGLFTRFPGAPRSTDLVAHQGWVAGQTGRYDADYYLLAARDRSPAGVEAALAAAGETPDFARRFDVATAHDNLDKDKSSLTALNIRGLLHLDSFFTFLMAVTATAMFVFGLIMARRREYVTLRAQGLGAAEVRRLVLAESGLSAVLGAAIGVAVGVLAAGEFVRVLRPIFVLSPKLSAPAGEVGVLVGLLLLATVLAGLVATVLINRLQPTELLREE